EIVSLLPSMRGDVFGKKWATNNYGIVCTGEGVASFLAGPGAAWMFARTGSWTEVFWAMIACDLIGAFLALLWLKPLVRRSIEESESGLHAPAPAVGMRKSVA